MTKLKILLIVIAIISASTLEAQDYKKYNYYITMAQLQQNIDSAVYFYDKAFVYSDSPLLDDVLYATKAYAKAGNDKKCIKYFKILYRHGYSYSNVFEDYYPIELSAKLKVKLKKVKVPKIDFDIDFISEFSEYVGREQFIRTQMRVDTTLLKYMFRADSLDHVLLKSHIDESGYPDESRIGRYKMIPQTLIIHIISNESTKDSWPNYYKPLFVKLAAEGRISYSFIVSLDDRHNMIWNNYQLYGTVFMMSGFYPGITDAEVKKLKSKLIVPIKDIQNIDKRRAEMGLPPFYYEAKGRNLEIPEGYKYTEK